MQTLARSQASAAVISEARASLLHPRRPVTPAVAFAQLQSLPRKLAPLIVPRSPGNNAARPSLSGCLKLLQDASAVAEHAQALRELLSSRENRTRFIELDGFGCLQALLRRDVNAQELAQLAILNVSRVISKLSSHTSVLSHLQAHPVVRDIAYCLVKHRGDLQIVVRLLFALGNATDTPTSAAHQLLKPCVEDLLAVMKELSLKKLKGLALSTPCSETEDALIKCVRLIANLTLSESLATIICSSPSLLLLLDLCKECTIVSSEELILNILLLCNNVTYYDSTDNILLARRLQLLKALPLALLYDNVEIQTEAVSVLGNLSRKTDVIEVLGNSHPIFDILVALLDHCNVRLLSNLCGVWTNLLSNTINQEILLNYIDKVSDILDIATTRSDKTLCTIWCRMMSNLMISGSILIPLYLSDELCVTLQTALESLGVNLIDILNKQHEDDCNQSWQETQEESEAKNIGYDIVLPIFHNYRHLEPLPSPTDNDSEVGDFLMK